MKIYLPLLMLAALAGYGEKSTGSPAIKAQYAATSPSTPTASELSGAPKRDYWQPAASLIAGSYSSDCMRLPATARAKETLVIAADGSYTIAGMADSLLNSELTILSHTRNPGASDGLLINASSQSSALAMMNGELGRGSAYNLRHAGLRMSCDESAAAIALSGKNLYAVYASVLEAAPPAMTCTSGKPAAASPLAYQFKDGTLTINGDSYQLTEMDEMVSLAKGWSALSYKASSQDEQRGVTVNVDTTGTIREVLTFSAGGVFSTCTPQ